MELSKPLIEKNDRGETIVNLEVVEEFLDYCESLEVAVNKFRDILADPNLNDALLDVYDPEREPASEDICKAFLAMKQVLAKVA